MVFKDSGKEISLANLIYRSMRLLMNITFWMGALLGIAGGILYATGGYSLGETLSLSIMLFILILAGGSLSGFPLRGVRDIQKQNKVLQIDAMSLLAGKKLNEEELYLDKDWYVAVYSTSFVVINRNYVTKVLTVLEGRSYNLAILQTVTGKKLKYRIPDQCPKYKHERLLRAWMRGKNIEMGE